MMFVGGSCVVVRRIIDTIPTVGRVGPKAHMLGLGSTICPMSEIVCFPVLNFSYSHVENSLFFALDLVVSL